MPDLDICKKNCPLEVCKENCDAAEKDTCEKTCVHTHCLADAADDDNKK